MAILHFAVFMTFSRKTGKAKMLKSNALCNFKEIQKVREIVNPSSSVLLLLLQTNPNSCLISCIIAELNDMQMKQIKPISLLSTVTKVNFQHKFYQISSLDIMTDFRWKHMISRKNHYR